MPSTPRYGLSFSHRHAARLGLDPREAFLALLIHLKPGHLRLSLYWDEIALEPGRYDFETIRWYLDRCEEYGSQVLLTIGLKGQRHPDCFPPAWLSGRAPPSEDRLIASVMLMLERGVALLADYNTIDSWQVENDAFLAAVRQPGGWPIGPALLQREVGVVREVDPRRRPVVVTYSGLSLLDRRWRQALAAGDVLGLNLSLRMTSPTALRRLWNAFALDPLGSGLYARLRIRERAIAAERRDKQLWITELNVEPVEREGPPGRPAPTLGVLLRQTSLAARSGAARAYVLGVESWLLRRQQGDTRSWECARELLRPQGAPSG